MDMVRVSPTTYTYTWIVGDGALNGNGIMSVLLSKGIDISGNVVIAKPTEGSSITVDNIAPANQDAVLTLAQTVLGGAAVNIIASGAESNNVWLAPAGTVAVPAANVTTITKAVNGNAYSIRAPTTVGSYHLYVSDAAGNISAASTLAVVVDNSIVPANQDAVLLSSQTVQGGAIVNIASSGTEANRIWLASAGTSTLPAANGTIITMAANGIASTILAPTTEGTYYVYVSNSAGNLSAASLRTVIVDNSAPSGAITVNAGFTIAVNKTTNTITMTQAGVFEAGNTLPINPALITIDSADDNETTPNALLDAASINTVTSTTNTLIILLKEDGAANVNAILAAFTGTLLDSVDFTVGWLRDLAGNISTAAGASGTTPKTLVTVGT